MSYTGGCHCGRIRFTVDGEIGPVVDCNCSLCRKRGGLLWFVPAEAVHHLGEAAAIGTYTFNTHRIQHHFCVECGIAPYSEGRNPDGSPVACINVRCLEGVDLDALTVQRFDGAKF